jgi:hypothetical protein
MLATVAPSVGSRRGGTFATGARRRAALVRNHPAMTDSIRERCGVLNNWSRCGQRSLPVN